MWPRLRDLEYGAVISKALSCCPHYYWPVPHCATRLNMKPHPIARRHCQVCGGRHHPFSLTQFHLPKA